MNNKNNDYYVLIILGFLGIIAILSILGSYVFQFGLGFISFLMGLVSLLFVYAFVRKKHENTKIIDAIFMCVLSIMIILSLFTLSFLISKQLPDDTSSWGVFGDYVGGILNPILSFLSLIGILYTIKQQSDDKEKQSEIFNRQQFETTFTAILSEHNDALDRVRSQPLHEILFHASQNSTDSNNYFFKNKINQNHELRSYFIVLYQLLKFISINVPNSKISVSDFENDNNRNIKIENDESLDAYERTYSNIVRAFIPNDILLLLAFNCISPSSNKNVNFSQELPNFYNYRGLVNRYKILEHLQLSTYLENTTNGISDFFIKEDEQCGFYTIMTYHLFIKRDEIELAFGRSKTIEKLESIFLDVLKQIEMKINIEDQLAVMSSNSSNENQIEKIKEMKKFKEEKVTNFLKIMKGS